MKIERQLRRSEQKSRGAKFQYKNKIEERLGSNNLKAAWDGVKRMTGLNKTQNKPVHIPMYKSDSDLSEALHIFPFKF